MSLRGRLRAHVNANNTVMVERLRPLMKSQPCFIVLDMCFRTHLGEYFLLPFKINVPLGISPVRSQPYRMNPMTSTQVDAILDTRVFRGWSNPTIHVCLSQQIIVIPKYSAHLRITVKYQHLNRIGSFSRLPVPRVDQAMKNCAQVLLFRSMVSLDLSIKSLCILTPSLSRLLLRSRGFCMASHVHEHQEITWLVRHCRQ